MADLFQSKGYYFMIRRIYFGFMERSMLNVIGDSQVSYFKHLSTCNNLYKVLNKNSEEQLARL